MEQAWAGIGGVFAVRDGELEREEFDKQGKHGHGERGGENILERQAAVERDDSGDDEQEEDYSVKPVDHETCVRGFCGMGDGSGGRHRRQPELV